MLEIDYKVLFGTLAAIIAVFNYSPYLIGAIKRTLKPHAFSWIVWTLMTSVTFLAQITDNAGPGAWATGATAVTLFLIAVLAVRNGGYKITRSDKLSFIGALSAVPIWIATSDPMWAVIIIVLIEALGFFPTYRKGFMKPYEESVLAFALTILKYSFALLALENYTVTTMLFPVALVVLSTGLVLELLWRRSLKRRV